jgi:hypothetical protein
MCLSQARGWIRKIVAEFLEGVVDQEEIKDGWGIVLVACNGCM